MVVIMVKFNSQLFRKVRLFGCGCGECMISIVGIIDNGESVMINVSGMSLVSMEI